MEAAYKIKSVIIGHAVGDALGVPVEFSERAELDYDPVSDMRGYGLFDVPEGSWSDDTSMTLCALHSLANGKLDFEDIMKNFGKWLNNGEFTPTGFNFDVGGTCCSAILRYSCGADRAENCGLSDEFSNGNGSLMRILPFALYLYYDKNAKKLPLGEKLGTIHKASSMTHANGRCLIACGIYSIILWAILDNASLSSVYEALEKAKDYYKGEKEFYHFERIFMSDFKETPRGEIRGSGYVLHSLEASIWCLLNSESYRECVLKAVNLGEDTDTTAAITGGLAGALYGYDNIPGKWRQTLIKREKIESDCERMSENIC